MAVYGDETKLNGVALAFVTEKPKHVDGIGIASVDIDSDHHLIMTYTDGTTTDAGAVSTPDALEDFVRDWLDAHPEATTTVVDGSITAAKLQQDFLDELTATDTTLTESGVAADAKEVGDRFAELGDAAMDDIVSIAHGGTGASTKAAAKVALEILGYSVSSSGNGVAQLSLPDGTPIYPKTAPAVVQGVPAGGLHTYASLGQLFTAATGGVTTATALATLNPNTVAVVTNSDNFTVKLSDAPMPFGLAILFKGISGIHQGALYFGYGSSPALYAYLHGSQGAEWVNLTE